MLAEKLNSVYRMEHEITWNWVDEAQDHVELERKLEGHLHLLEELKYGYGLSGKEETHERGRWLRANGSMCHIDELRQLTRTIYAFFIELSQAGGQQILGERAGLPLLTQSMQPSDLVRFGPIYPPDPPPLSEVEYERKVGGRSVLGARLIWWCAAAESPEEFDFPVNFSPELLFQPYWAVDQGYTVRANHAALLLIRDTASEICRAFDVLTKSGAFQSSEEVSPHFGPGKACTFWWEGRPVDLPPQLWKLLDFMWKRRHVIRKQVIEQVWADGTSRSNFDCAKTRLNAILSNANIPVTISSRKGWVQLEIMRP